MKLMIEKSLRGHHGSALSHIDSGVKILSQVHEQERGTPQQLHPSQGLCVPRECLDVIFARLDAQRVQVRFLPRTDALISAQSLILPFCL